MSSRKKANTNKEYVKKGFANWFSQLCAMIMTRYFYIIAGRGSAKTTDLQVERLIAMMYDMPGAPVCWVADTYANLQKNVLRTVLDGLEAKGYREGVHYVLGKCPPSYTAADKANLDPSLREHFWKPFNRLGTYKHTLIFFTGFNVTFGSLDRPASLAGNSYVHAFGDEVKYFKESKIANLLKAIRGYRAKYGNSVFYRGHTFTTDMPNTANIGEHDWILKMGSRINKKALMVVLKTAFIVNECLNELLAAKQSRKTEEIIKKQRTYNRWLERWIAARLFKDAHTFFYIASSYVNVDILTPEWFEDALASNMGDYYAAVLSILDGTASGDRFYANLQDKHFFEDGIDEKKAERFGILDEEDSSILRYLDHDKPLDAGMDFGNMNSLTVFQEDSKKNYRALKFHYTLSPDWLRELADNFRKYHAPQRNKILYLNYDRAANNYKKAKQDLASQFKACMEYEKDNEDGSRGKRTGWKVILMSEGQGNIGSNEEYNFMQELFGGNNRRLPRVLIDKYQCKPLKCSMESALTKKNSKGLIEKDKKSEKLKPIHRLVLESTNPSDSFKYGLMTKLNRKLLRAKKTSSTGEMTIRE